MDEALIPNLVIDSDMMKNSYTCGATSFMCSSGDKIYLLNDLNWGYKPLVATTMLPLIV